MFSAYLLDFEHAAQAFGVSPDTLLDRLDGGGLPEAVRRNGSWTVPAGSLTSIAEREGWSLDLTDESAPRPTPVPEHLDCYINETMAAHAAVVLAKTQATAARAETRDLATKVRQLSEELEAERAERQRLAGLLAETRKQQAVLERDRAVAEARTEEVRRQVDQERVERSLLSSRLVAMEADRDDALSTMTWWSRRRYGRRRGTTGAPRTAAPAAGRSAAATSPPRLTIASLSDTGR
ncbi:MAG: hypothetical protein ACFCVK_05425 [Acidimicrobiales bacterium]